MSVLHERAVLPVADARAFDAVRSAIETAFSSGKIREFLRGMQRTGLRIRDFEAVLRKGLLGTAAAAEYARLNDSDQGQIREFYLATLEKVSPELRSEFFKLYAYY